jgi:hypothetical protein
MLALSQTRGVVMVNGGIARLSTLAVGLGIGAALAASPGIAAADASNDWLSAFDLLGGALPAPATSGLDLAISFDGYSLLSDGSASAVTTSGDYDLAIAYGANSLAEAVDGQGDTAFASGEYARAVAYDGTGDYALADGTRAYADAGGQTGANYDTAIDIGNNTVPTVGSADGAYAGAGALDGGVGTGSYDTAIDVGNNTDTMANGDDGAYAGAGGLVGYTGDGNHDTAINVGNDSGVGANATAVQGDYNSASDYGNNTGNSFFSAFAGIGNGDSATAVGNNTVASAGGYLYDTSLTGNNDVANAFDPFGTLGGEATSGASSTASGNWDLAAIFGVDGASANSATGADYLYDIVTALGNESGAAAATSGGWLSELLSLF